MAPNARIDDGLFDIVLVERVTKLEFLGTFPKVFKGAHLDHPKVKSFQGKEVVIETPSRQLALVDGELFESTPIRFTMMPKALKCIVPDSFTVFPA